MPLESGETICEETRYEKGLAIQSAIYGEEIAKRYQWLPGGFAVEIPKWLTELCFGDFCTRKGLDEKTRELLTVVMLATMGGAEVQVRSHICGAIKVGNMGTEEISYGANNLPTHSIGVDSTLVDFEYDEKDNLKKATTAYGVKIENTYDSNNNLTKTVLTNMDGKQLVTEKTYDADGRFVDELKDELGNTTKLSFDNLGNLKQVTDALGGVSQLNYTNNGLLKELILKKGAESANAKYTYNSRNLLQSIVLSNGSKYEFFYSQQSLLTKVTLNGYTVFEFTYDEKSGNIDTQSYGGGDKYKFIYNDKGQVQQVMYVKAGASEGTKKYEYIYDECGQLTCVKDEIGNVLSNYSYDNDGRINRIYNGEYDISQEYDTLGNINTMSSKVKNKRIYQSFDSVQRSKGSHPGSLSQIFGIDGFIGTFEKNGNIEKAGTGYLQPVDNVSLRRDGIIPCVRVSSNEPLRYVLPFYSEYPLDCGCIMFWFKLDSIHKASQLFYCKSSSNDCAIQAYLQNNKVVLSVTDCCGKYEDVLISTDDIKEGWNFFAVNFMNRHDGDGYPDVSEFSLTINANTQFKRYQNPRKDLDLGANPVYNIGYVPNNAYNMVGYIAAVCITQRDYLTLDKIQRYYRASKNYVINNQFIDEEVNAVDFGQTTMYTINSSIQDRWEIFPLHSGVTSLNGIRPVSFDLRRVSMSDKNGTFHFNNKIKRYAYVADGAGTLCYNIGQCEDGTVMMRAFTDSTTHKRQYLFDGKDINGKTLGLYRDENLNLCIDYNGLTVETGLQFTTNDWHEVGLSFASRIVTNYETGTSLNKRLRLFLDGQVFETLLSNVKYNDLKFYIGQRSSGDRASTNLGLYQECYPLHGQIEMLAMNCTYNEVFTLQALAKELLSITKITEYDELGMLRKVDVHTAGEIIFSNEYEYKTRPDNKYLSQQIRREAIRYTGNVAVRNYETDSLGRVTKITDSTFGNHNYKYNYRGFLEEADGERYVYDGNGNIMQLGTTVFAYDRDIKDKLISVGGSAVSYGSKYSLNPIGWKDRMYKYEGRRLIQYTTGSGYHEYTYNDQGLRIAKKKYTGETTKYYYAGDKLITEINSACRLDFLYDENGQLYGLIKDNASKYFYVKDCLSNILGIVNENGTLVTKYNYTGFGKCQTTYSSDNISWQNPFRFKGYYLDSESGMYYCHTRYYVPEWGRWLNADHPDFLEFDNLSNVNLFSYCGNNPVMCVDPTGTFVSAIFGALSAVVSGLLLGQSAGQIIYNACVGFAMGLIVDVISVSTCGVGTVLAATVALGIGGAMADVGAQMLFEDKKWDEIDWWRAATVGAISAATSIIGIGVGKALPVGGGSILSKMCNLVKDIGSWSAGFVFSFGVGLSMNLLTGCGIIDFNKQDAKDDQSINGGYVMRHFVY